MNDSVICCLVIILRVVGCGRYEVGYLINPSHLQKFVHGPVIVLVESMKFVSKRETLPLHYHGSPS
jgi:hypothetical protein